MIVETVFGTILVMAAVSVGVGGPYLALHFQSRETHERHLVEAVMDHAATVDSYRRVTQLDPEDIGSPIAPEHQADEVIHSSLVDH